jgi:hypothetical protein
MVVSKPRTGVAASVPRSDQEPPHENRPILKAGESVIATHANKVAIGYPDASSREHTLNRGELSTAYDADPSTRMPMPYSAQTTKNT